MNKLHVDSSGRVRDNNGALVYLRGVNTSGLGYANGISDITQARINAVTSLVHANLWRIDINTSWWNNNVLLTDGTTHYQAWIQQVIGWIEAAGCYVEIIAGPGFCTAPGSPGPAQSAVDSCNNTETLYINSHISFWQSVVPLYVNDNAVLYNVMNEPTYSDTITQNQALITTIQAIKSDAVCIVYNFNYEQVVSGSVGDYTGSNLILDYHIYDDPSNTWQTKIGNNAPVWNYAQAHGHGIMIGEYSAFNVTNAPRAYIQSMAHQAITRGAALAYYNEFGLLQSDNATLTPVEGALVAPAYQRIADVAAGNVKFARV